MAKSNAVIAHTKKWLERVVIGENFCPFAAREFDAGRIHYAVIETADLQSQLERLASAFDALNDNAAMETSLLIFPNGLSDFGAYLELLELANALLIQQGHEGTYQLASFHPEYIFEGAPPEDASHFTNRSPYPMLHILREDSVEAALKSYPNPEAIPQRNIKYARALGRDALHGLLSACRK